MAFLLIFNHDKKHRKKAMTNYITPNANYDLFSTASYAALDTYLKNDAIVKFKTVLDTVTSMFSSEILKCFEQKSSNSNPRNAGRRAYQPEFMFKLCLLQRRVNKADNDFVDSIYADVRYQYALGITDLNCVPSSKTIWKFRNIFDKAELFEKVFNKFVSTIEDEHELNDDKLIIDSSFNEAPKQRNTFEENAIIKAGNGDSLWNDNPQKKCHKDIDARWTKKRDETHYGYKAHASVGATTKLIHMVKATAANVHDSQIITDIIPTDFKGSVYADAGYIGASQLKDLNDRGIETIVCEKGYRNHPLTEEQKKNNRTKSKIRCRVEHVFGFIEQSMKGFILRSVGMIRAKSNIFLTCLVYNIDRARKLKFI